DRRPAGAFRPAGHAAVRPPAGRGHPVHRAAHLHLPRRLCHVPVRFRCRRVPDPRDRGRQRGGLHAAGQAGDIRPGPGGPGAVRTGCVMPRVAEDQVLAARRRDAVVTVTVLALTAAAFAAVADHGILTHLQRADDAWLRLMISGRSAPVTAAAKVFNWLGLVYVTLPVRIAIAGFLALRRRWWHLAAFVAAIVLSEVLIGTLKGIYDRARPPGSLVVTSGTSFPSGHSVAATVTVVAAVIALVPPGRARVVWGAAAAVFSVLMALSRAYLGAHWLSDALAGVLLGASCALLAAFAVGELQGRRTGQPAAAHGLRLAVPAPGRYGRPDQFGRGLDGEPERHAARDVERQMGPDVDTGQPDQGDDAQHDSAAGRVQAG